MADIYEFSKSNMPQSIESETPFLEKNYSYINDLNSGVYSSSLSLVTIDMSSIYNSQSLFSPEDAYIVIPVTMVSAYTSNNSSGTLVAPSASQSPWAVHSLKSFHHLIHSAELVCDSKTLHQNQSYLGNYINFKLLSGMSQSDLKNLGPTLGMGDTLDNFESMKWNAQSTVSSSTNVAYPGTDKTSFTLNSSLAAGLSNNTPLPMFSTSQSSNLVFITSQTGATNSNVTVTLTAANAAIVVGQTVTGQGIPPLTTVSAITTTTLTLSQAATSTVAATLLSFYTSGTSIQSISGIGNNGDMATQGAEFNGTYNQGLFSRIKKYADVSNSSGINTQSFFGPSASTGSACSTLLTETQVQNEFRAYSKILNTNYMVTYDSAIIRLKDLFPACDSIGLIKKWNATIRLYVNTGSVASIIQNGGYVITSGSTNNFSNVCPLIQSSLLSTPSTACGIVSSLCIGKTLSTSLFGGVNLANSGASHPISNVRLYYPMIKLKPTLLLPYLNANRAKKVVYTDVLYSSINNITSGSTTSTIVQAGVCNLKGLLILPFISSSVYNSVATSITGTTTLAQWQSPTDSCPNSNGPLSLTNIQVTVAGVNILATPLTSTYDNFLQQVSIYDKVAGTDLGISSGLISQTHWENAYRVYFVNLERCADSDNLNPRNIQVTFTNSTNTTLDIMFFTEYYKSCTIDCEQGSVQMD